MENKKSIMLDIACPDLLVSPHIVDTLLHIVVGEWHVAPAQQEQLVAHLMECSYCRMSLIVMLASEQKEERLNSYSEEPLHTLLTQFVTIHHEILAKDYEQMGAYAEAIRAEGKQEADNRFLILAEHIRKCSGCKSTLDETLDFLNDSVDATRNSSLRMYNGHALVLCKQMSVHFLSPTLWCTIQKE